MLLERRLDNVVYRMGFATSRAEARQLVRHGHFRSTDARSTSPSHRWSGRVTMVDVREKSRKVERISGALEALEGRGVPQWLEIDKDDFKGTVKALPHARGHHAADPGAADRRALLALTRPRMRSNERDSWQAGCRSRRTGES